MSYRDLYESIQLLEPHISRNYIKEKVLELTGLPSIRAVRTTLDTTICRGFYISARNQNHRLVQQLGTTIVVSARGLNRCWDRFVTTKELMHVFDDPEMASDSGDRFEKALTELTEPGPENFSPQMESEIRCFWMALGVLCPENVRRTLKARRKQGFIDDYSIALRIRIPQHYVPRLFQDRYEMIIDAIISGQ